MIVKREGYLKKGTILFDKYTILSAKPVGEGSNWIVYICTDYEGHLFCLKEYYPITELFTRDENGFLRCNKGGKSFLLEKEPAIDHELEMQNAARMEFIENDNDDELKHTNWESVYCAKRISDLKYGDTFYIVMDILSGQALSDAILDGFSNIIDALKVMIELGKVVGVLHKKGILHLDIKPQNFFLTSSGKIIVLDFGSAILKGKEYSEEDITNTGIGQFTEGFCSSELIAISQEDSIEKKVSLLAQLDEKADVYAYLKIVEEVLNKYDDFGLLNILQEKYENKKYGLDEYISSLEDCLIAEYHKVESLDSLLDSSRQLFQYKKREEKMVRYFPELCRNKKSGDNVIAIIDIIQSTRDVIIQGGEGSGKTLLLLQSWKELLNNRYLAVYTDMRLTDKDGDEAWEYLINVIKREYHIAIDDANRRVNDITILCDNIMSLDTALIFHEHAKKQDVKLIMAVSDCGREIASDYNAVNYYKLGELSIEQKKVFFEQNRELFSEELREMNSGESFNCIVSVDDLVTARRIKKRYPKVNITKVSLMEEKYKLFIDDENVPEKKLSLIYGFNHFLPWIAIQLYFDDKFLFWEARKPIESIRRGVLEYEHMTEAVSYYISVGILAQGKKEFTNIPTEYDYGRNIYITKYVPGRRIHFYKESDFCFFVAKYILNDYKNQQHKESSLLCRFQFNYLVIKQLSYLVDVDTLMEWYHEDGMSSSRYASRNIMAAIIEKGGRNSRIDVGTHYCYDEKWPEMDEIDPYVNWSHFHNIKRMQVVKRKEDIWVFYGIQSSVINVRTWKEAMGTGKKQTYEMGYRMLSLEEAGMKRVFFLRNFEITDKMELPLLVKVKLNHDNDNAIEKTEKIHATPMFISNIGKSHQEVIDIYDVFDKTYILTREENPMKIIRADRFFVSELALDKDKPELIANNLFELEGRYFKSDEFPITIKGCSRIIALGMVSKKCLDDYLHKPDFDLYSDISKMSFVIQFYVRIEDGWYRYPIQLNEDKIRCFDVMDLDDGKSVIVYLRNGVIRRHFYNRDLCLSFDPVLYSDSFVLAFALLKYSKKIAIIDKAGYLKIINLDKEKVYEVDLRSYNIKKETLKALDEDYLWFADETDSRRCYFVMMPELEVKVFDFSFD